MNRERLTILRDHLASLPPVQFDMTIVREEAECGTVACVAGWAGVLAIRAGDAPDDIYFGMEAAERWLGLGSYQAQCLFTGSDDRFDDLTPKDAVAAIQSMLDSPDDDALPVWPEVSL